MLEPYSEDEKDFIRYLIKKYLPGFGNQGDKDSGAIMFEEDQDTNP